MMTRRTIGFLLVVPIALLILSGLLVDARGPYNLGANLDPDYCYLLNSLSILLFHQPGHVDHPGTPVQEIGAAVVFAKWLGASLSGSWASLPGTVLSRPEDFLHAINFVLNLLLGGAVFLAGLKMYRASGSLLAALVLQVSVFLFRETVLTLPRVDPEPVLVAVGFALMVPLIPMILAKEPAKAPGALAAGAILGFGLATKVTFLPWVAVGALCTGWKQRFRLIGACLLALFIFLLPILSSLPQVFRWLNAVLTHRGVFGSGPSGPPSSAQVLMNFKALYAAEPSLFYWLCFYSAVLLALQFGVREPEKSLARSIQRLMWAGWVAIVFQIAMALKHFVAARYLVPALVLTALLNGFLVLLFSAPVFRAGLRAALAFCGIVLLIGSCWTNVSRLKQWAMDARRYQDDVSRLAEVRQKFRGCAVIGYYSGSGGQYALAFGSEYTRGDHGKLLDRLYPDTIYFHNEFKSFSLEPRQAQVRGLLKQGRCVLMEGGPRLFGTLPPDLTVEPLVTGAGEAIGRLILKGSESACSNLPVCANLPPNAIAIEAEKFTAGTVVADNAAFGAGIGVIVSPKYPAYVEYTVPIPAGGRYELWIRYAAAEARPLTLSINGRFMTSTACSETTGGWYPNDQRARKIGIFDLDKGLSTLRLESTLGPFPHIDRLGFVLVSTR